MIHKGDTYMPRGLLMGNINCPKCGELIINPKVSDINSNRDHIVICKCGNWFVVECKKLK